MTIQRSMQTAEPGGSANLKLALLLGALALAFFAASLLMFARA